MPLPFSDFQTLLERFAGGFLVLVKGVGIDVQCSGWLGVTQQTSYRGYVCAVGYQKAGVAVTQTMDIQFLRKSVFLEDQLEPPGKGTRHHRITAIVLAECEVILSYEK